MEENSEGPCKIIWGLSVPGAHSHRIPTHTSPSQSLFSGSGLKAMGPPSPQLHLHWPIQWMACFRHMSSILNRGAGSGQCSSNSRDSLCECRVLSRFWGTLAFPDYGPQDVLHGMFNGGGPCKSGGQTSTEYPEVRIVESAQMYLIIRPSFFKKKKKKEKCWLTKIRKSVLTECSNNYLKFPSIIKIIKLQNFLHFMDN